MSLSIPHTTGTIRSGGCDIYYEATGSGPALIFAHGLGGNYLSWWQQIPHFSDRFTCVTFSHRGFWPLTDTPASFGTSDIADDLAALIDHLHLQEVVLVAQSMGGWTCLEYAMRFPGRVRALVLSSTTGAIDFRALGHPGIEAISEWEVRSEEVRRELAGEGILSATGRRMAAEQRGLYYLYCRLNELTPASFRDQVRKTIRGERVLPPERILSLKTPMLFITGSEDIVFPPAAASALAAVIPNAQFEQIFKAGHSVYFERAAEYNNILDSFLHQF